MEAKTRDRGRSSITPGGVADTGKVLMLLGNEGNGETARGPRKFSLVFDEAEGLPCGNGREGALASGVGSKQRKTASSGIVRACKVIFSDTNIQVCLHKKYYLSIG